MTGVNRTLYCVERMFTYYKTARGKMTMRRYILRAECIWALECSTLYVYEFVVNSCCFAVSLSGDAKCCHMIVSYK